MREYNARRREHVAALQSANNKKLTRKLKAEIFEALGGVCRDCGHVDQRVLQVDHIDGGGCAHRAKTGGAQYWRTVLRRIEEFQLLCANCHMIKSYRQEPVA